DEIMRTRVEILNRQVSREKLAAAIDEVGAGLWNAIDETADTRAAFHQRDVDESDGDKREGHRAEKRTDHDAPLQDRRPPFAHPSIVPADWRPASQAKDQGPRELAHWPAGSPSRRAARRCRRDAAEARGP